MCPRLAVVVVLGLAALATAAPTPIPPEYPIVPIIVVPGLTSCNIDVRMHHAEDSVSPQCWNDTVGDAWCAAATCAC